MPPRPVIDQIVVGEHHALRRAGGAGGVEHDRHVARPPALHLGGEEVRTGSLEVAALRPGRPRRREAAPGRSAGDRAGRRRRSAPGAGSAPSPPGACPPAPGPRRSRCAPRRWRGRTPSPRRRRPGRAEPGWLPAPARRPSPSRAGDGCRRRSPRSRRGGARACAARRRGSGPAPAPGFQVYVCQMPRSFSRIDGRSPRWLACAISSRGNVSGAGILEPRCPRVARRDATVSPWLATRAAS